MYPVSVITHVLNILDSFNMGVTKNKSYTENNRNDKIFMGRSSYVTRALKLILDTLILQYGNDMSRDSDT